MGVRRAARVLCAALLLTASCGDPLGSLATLDCASGCELPNAITSCIEDCAIERCLAGFGDCNRDPSDGCEVDLSSSDSDCGSCGNACAGCARGSCRAVELVAARLEGRFSADLVVLGGEIYFIDGFATRSEETPTPLLAVAKGGGEPRLVLAGPRFSALAADGASLFGIALEQAGGFRVLEVGTDSGLVTELARGDGVPRALAAEADEIYWCFILPDAAQATYVPGAAVMRARAGGDAEPIKRWDVPGGPLTLTARAGSVYWSGATELEGGGFGLTLERFAPDSGVSVLRSDLGGSCLLADSTDLYALVVRGDVDRRRSELHRVPLDGTESRLLWSEPGAVSDCQQSTSSVYASMPIEGSIFEIAKADGSAALVAGGQQLSAGLAGDGEFLYWVTRDEIRRVKMP